MVPEQIGPTHVAAQVWRTRRLGEVDTDERGLHQILGQFAARSLNLTKIESRPTKLGLGDYCFVIELEGHLSDEVVGDCLKELHMELAAVKILGSYPVFGERAPERREQIAAARAEADAWMSGLRARIGLAEERSH